MPVWRAVQSFKRQRESIWRCRDGLRSLCLKRVRCWDWPKASVWQAETWRGGTEGLSNWGDKGYLRGAARTFEWGGLPSFQHPPGTSAWATAQRGLLLLFPTKSRGKQTCSLLSAWILGVGWTLGLFLTSTEDGLEKNKAHSKAYYIKMNYWWGVYFTSEKITQVMSIGEGGVCLDYAFLFWSTAMCMWSEKHKTSDKAQIWKNIDPDLSYEKSSQDSPKVLKDKGGLRKGRRLGGQWQEMINGTFGVRL